MYGLNQDVQDEGLEREVEEMRRKRLAEEAQKQEDQRIEARKNKKLQELRERKKFNTGGTININSYKQSEVQSYDLSGNVVEVAFLSKLPNLVPTCAKAADKPEAKNGVSTERVAFRRNNNKAQAAKELLGSASYNEDALLKAASAKDHDNSKLKYTTGPYDKIVPAIGVTFTEIGKNPKVRNESLGQLMGKITKAEFRTLISDYSLGKSAGFTGIGKISLFSARIFLDKHIIS